MEFRAVADRVLWSKSQGFESNVKNSTLQSNVERGATCGNGSQRAGGACRGMPDALACSEANNSLPGYCSVNSRNSFCARAFCFSRRAAKASTILPNGLRLRPFSAVLASCSNANLFVPVNSAKPDENPQVPVEVLKRYLSIFSDLIFDSSVDRGMPNLAAAPVGPNTRPWLAFRASSIMFFSCASSLRGSSIWFFGSVRDGCFGSNQLSSIENISVSQSMTERSTTFCNSRMFPGQG